ncbi:hypothetical protein DDB_G0281263 [Dictyostelium discoideum AX4]|uniref:Uncharacterized protein n=1 Tax=Dictyostelium discoideum TaxID=44689 RepID=Q54U57_DICDI|nr:hypothetical protein DDB_G0281263 [Dictyostelium discoideum AX4]EAL66928.1 hypothetical protein DDB_G0281263 [Dictyostelium discoideum AX4]|eukprot:XP_640919.1 hypothetical protein DDB_G0281263 [Dictyostelium discoideum AX4]
MSGDKLKATLTIGITDSELINLESNGNDITDEYIKNEFQEDTSKGGINDLLKNIISMQQITNVELTKFVNKEKSEKLATIDQTVQTKSKKQQNKEKQQQKQQQQQQQNKKRVENDNGNGNDTNNEDEKVVKQQKLE